MKNRLSMILAVGLLLGLALAFCAVHRITSVTMTRTGMIETFVRMNLYTEMTNG